MQTMVIRIDHEAGKQPDRYYPVSLHIDDGGAADWASRPVAEMRLPVDLPCPAGSPALDATTIQRFLLSGQAHDGTLTTVGNYLYRLLAENPVGAAWAKAAKAYQAGRNPSGHLRTFFDVRPYELSALPWELMARGDGAHLFLDESNVCVRGTYLPAAVEPMPVPIRLLVAVGNPHETDLRAYDEVDAIWSAIGDHPGEWHVEVMWGPTQDELFECFKQVRPHIFHFIGHSGTSAYGNHPALEFRSAANDQTWDLTSYMIVNMPKHALPRFVFLNACRTTEPLADDRIEEFQKAVLGVASAFDHLGSHAVLTMQADIPSDPAVRFTREVYRRLADGEAIDRAVRGGRERLFQSGTVSGDWALPCLTVRGNPDNVFSVKLALAPDVARQLINDRYRDVISLVDRTAEHRKVWGGADCGGLPSGALLVTGEGKVGKSTLVSSCLFTWNLRGCQAVYVDLRLPRRTLNWLDVVRQIRDGLATRLPGAAAEPLRRFNHDLAYLRDGLDPEPLPPVGGRTDDGGLWLPATEREPELREAVFASVRHMLEEAAGGEPLLLAVDHLGAGLPDHIRNEVVPRLLEPIAEGAVDHVSVVVVETTDRAEDLLSQRFHALAVTIRILPFARTYPQAVRFYRQFGALTRRPFTGEWQKIAEILAQRTDPSMMPGELITLAAILPAAEADR
jgi:CHAT domain